MAIALVPSQTATLHSNATGTSIAASFPSSVGVGNLITTEVSVDNSVSVSNVQMTGESFVAAIQLSDPTNTQKIEGWYAKNTVGGQTQVTANFSATAPFRDIGIAEWSGADTAAPLDKTASAQTVGSAGSEISSPDVTPTSDGQLIWGAVEDNASAAPTANSPYTLLANTVSGIASEYQIQGTAAAVHADFAGTAATVWGVVLMTFKAAVLALPPSVGLSTSIAGTPSVAGIW